MGIFQLRLLQDRDDRRGRDGPHGQQGALRPGRLVPRPRPRPQPVARALEGRTILGFNYRMNELQGALGLAQLRKLDTIIAEQRKNKAAIKKALSVVPGIKFREHPRSRGRYGHLPRLQSPLGRDDQTLPEGPVERRGPRLLQRKPVALRPQLGALPGEVHGVFNKIPLCGPLVQRESGLRPGFPRARISCDERLSWQSP